jgi:hypothetical protein
MHSILQDNLLLFALKIYAFMLIVGPIAVRASVRFKAKLDPQLVPKETLPPDVLGLMMTHTPGITNLGFEPVGYVKVDMASNTQSFMLLFSNPKTSEWADVSVAKSKTQMKGYFEFITRCANDTQLDTSSNATAPVLFPTPKYHVCRFPQIQDPATLYKVHRMLVTKKLGAFRPIIPAKGEEMAELRRRLERYGPRQTEQGYMYLDPAGEYYRLTWKGAILGAWRSMWPISMLRGLWMREQGQAQLRSMGVAVPRTI